MSSQKTKFGDKEVNKKEFYSSKEAIFLDSVDLSKIIVSRKWKISDTKYKYFCGYINDGVIQSLCVILPQMRGYIKYFDDGGKNMSFVTDDKEVYKKYNEIWEVVRKLLKLKFTISPIRDDKYTNCLAYRYRYASEFYNWLPVFFKNAQVVSNYRYKSTILYSLPLFFLFLSFCYLVTFYSHAFALVTFYSHAFALPMA